MGSFNLLSDRDINSYFKKMFTINVDLVSAHPEFTTEIRYKKNLSRIRKGEPTNQEYAIGLTGHFKE